MKPLNPPPPVSAQIRHFVAAQTSSITQVLQTHFRLSPERAVELVQLGAIYANKERVEACRELVPGEYLRVHLMPKRYATSRVDWPRTVLHEHRDYLVVVKPFGIPVHATLDNVRENVLSCLRPLFGGELWGTGRLDVPAGGVLVYARSKEFQAWFNKALAERRVSKKYSALAMLGESALVAPKELRHYMEVSERAPKHVQLEPKAGYQECVLKITNVQAAAPGTQEVTLDLITGRTHQIRAQLAAVGHPLLGDKAYGAKRSLYAAGVLEPAIALWSTEVSWRMPSGETVTHSHRPAWDLLLDTKKSKVPIYFPAGK